jgi:tetratricopeptide (TPR) repeat protein
MKKYLSFLIVTLFSVLSGKSQETVSQGLFYLNELQFSKARNNFQGILKDTPNDIAALIGLGDAYLALNVVDSAKVVYQKALAVDAKNPLAWVGMGKVALMSNDRAGEATCFDRARRAGKTNPEIFGAIAEGCISLSKQDTATAQIYLTLGLELNPKLATLHLSTGNLETLKINVGKAINAYDRAIFFDPKSAIAYRNLGYIQALSRSYRDALTSFNKSLELNPDQILLHRYMGDLFYTIGRYPEAEKAYQTYMSKADVTTDDKERFAFTLFFNKKYKEAADILEQVLAVNHDESVLLRIRGYISFETGEYQKGLEYMNKFFQLHDPKKLLSSDYIYYAKILQNVGKDSLALENLEKAMALDPAKTEIYGDMAKLAAKSKIHKEAARYYKKMMDNGADKLSSWFQIGREFYFEGDSWKAKFDSLTGLQKTKKVPFTDSVLVKENIRNYYTKADSAFAQVTQLNPDFAGGHIWKGRIQSLLDPEAETTGAKESYEKALTILEKGDPGKNQKSIIECYKYLGSYYYLGFERLSKSSKQQAIEMKAKTIEYFTRIAALDPSDAQAKEVLGKLKGKK